MIAGVTYAVLTGLAAPKAEMVGVTARKSCAGETLSPLRSACAMVLEVQPPCHFRLLSDFYFASYLSKCCVFLICIVAGKAMLMTVIYFIYLFPLCSSVLNIQL